MNGQSWGTHLQCNTQIFRAHSYNAIHKDEGVLTMQSKSVKQESFVIIK
jgi:hypothetical protein